MWDSVEQSSVCEAPSNQEQEREREAKCGGAERVRARGRGPGGEGTDEGMLQVFYVLEVFS